MKEYFGVNVDTGDIYVKKSLQLDTQKTFQVFYVTHYYMVVSLIDWGLMSYGRCYIHFKIRTIDQSNRLCFVPVQHAKPDLYCACSQKHQPTSWQGKPLGHIILAPSLPFTTLSPLTLCAWPRSSNYRYERLCCDLARD